MSAATADPLARLAGAPISWGVCEVPGWGAMLEPERVLSEMASLGLRGTELGPVGYLPSDPAELRATLSRHGLKPVGAFLPLVFDPTPSSLELDRAARVSEQLASAGADVVVLAAIADLDWREPPSLGRQEWHAVARGLELARDVVEQHGLHMAVHPHVGSLIERAADVELLLELADVDWCLDTGHLVIGGSDPLRFAREHADRVAHVHLKDVDAALADEVEARAVSLPDATRRGLFRPLGEGCAQVKPVLDALAAGGYRGWLALEQDVMLDSADLAPGEGPIHDVRRCIEFVRGAA